MKKLLLNFACIALTACLALAAEPKIEDIPAKKLPDLALRQITSYFPDAEIVTAAKEGKMTRHYYATLNDGTALEFDKDGTWLLVDNPVTGVPQRMVNPLINSYLSKNIPDAKVMKMSKDKDRNVDITLDDGTIVRFDYHNKYLSTESPE